MVTSETKADSSIRQILGMFNNQIQREIEAEISAIAMQSKHFLDVDANAESIAEAYGLNKIYLRWHLSLILKALRSSLRVQIHDLSHQADTNTITLSFSHIALRGALMDSISRNIVNSAQALTHLNWMTDLIFLPRDSIFEIQLKWGIQNEKISADLVSAKINTGDWLAMLFVNEAERLAQAVNRAFNLDTMIQSRRLYIV
ncbi:MAG: hypothetical protein K0U90_07745 [Planctomycetes bacterium]|nr:hypothetical protein [Planctomycetota bacterium]